MAQADALQPPTITVAPDHFACSRKVGNIGTGTYVASAR